MKYLELNLEYNNIKNIGELELWIGINNLVSLTKLTLDLTKNKVSGGFYHHISSYLGKLSLLNYLHLSLANNLVLDYYFAELEKGLSNLTLLTQLHLDF